MAESGRNGLPGLTSSPPRLRIAPWQLGRDSWPIARRLYGILLILTCPNLGFAIAAAAPQTTVVQASLSAVDLLIVTPLVTGAAIACIYRHLTDQPLAPWQGIRQAGRSLPSLIGGWLILHALMVPGLIGFALAQAYLQLDLPFIALMLGAVAIGLCLPGLYFSTRCLFVLHHIVVQRVSIWPALRASWQQVQGRWWQVFRAILTINLIILPPLWLIPAIAATALQQAPSAWIDPVAPAYWQWVQVALRDGFSYLVTPFTGVYTFLLFWRLDIAADLLHELPARSATSPPETPAEEPTTDASDIESSPQA